MLKKEFTDLMFQFFVQSSKTAHALKSGTMPKNITPVQYGILELLYFTPGKQLVTICDCLNLSMPNGSRETKKLIEKGLLIKKQDTNDKRNHFLFLTQKGNELVQNVIGSIVNNTQEMYSHLDEKKQDEIAQSMKTLLSDLFIDKN